MSVNPYYRYMLSLSGLKQKETFFQRAWGRLNLLSREASRQSCREYREANIEMRACHNKLVLAQFNCESIKDEYASRIETLASEALNIIEKDRQARRRKERELQSFNRSAQYVIGRIVEFINPYAGLLNKTIGNSELHTLLTGPEQVTEEIYHPGEDVEYRTDFRARFSTYTWSLLLRGRDGTIDVFLIPSDKVLKLTKLESIYRPVAQLTARADERGIMWDLDGDELDWQGAQVLFLDLFQQLLDRTKEQMLKEKGISPESSLSHCSTFDRSIIPSKPEEKAVACDARSDLDYDYRLNQPAFFGPDEPANTASQAIPPFRSVTERSSARVKVAETASKCGSKGDSSADSKRDSKNDSKAGSKNGAGKKKVSRRRK